MSNKSNKKSKKFGSAFQADQGKINHVAGNRLERDWRASTVGRATHSTTIEIKVQGGTIRRPAWHYLAACAARAAKIDGTPFGVPSKASDLMQGGNLLAADYFESEDGIVALTNAKALVDGDNSDSDENIAVIEKVRTLGDRWSHECPIAMGRGLELAMFLSRNSRYYVEVLVPHAVKGLEREGLYYVATFDYSEYVRRCKDKSLYCGYREGYDKSLDKLGAGRNPELYGDYRRVKNEKFKIRKGILHLEIRPFGRSFQEIYPYDEWVRPPEMYEYRGGVFRKHTPSES